MDRKGGKGTGKQGKFLFQVNVEVLNAINLTEDYFHFFPVFSASPNFSSPRRDMVEPWRDGHYKGNTLAKMKKSHTVPFIIALVILTFPSRFQNLAININRYTFH